MTDYVESTRALPTTPDEITAALNRVYTNADGVPDPAVTAAGVDTLRRERWSPDEEQVTD